MRSAKIESAFVVAVLFSITAYTFAQTSSPQPIGHVQGLVTDDHGARIIQATGVFKGKTEKYGVKVNDEGEYRIELPEGSYIARFSAKNFCTSSGILIKVEANQVTNLDFELRPWGSHAVCDSPNAEFERIDARTAATFYIDVWFGESETTKERFEYRTSKSGQKALKAVFGGIVVRADEKISVHRFTHRIKAEGNVVIENGDKTIYATYAEFDYTKENPILVLKN